MGIKRPLQAAALIAASVILGLLTVQGTYAIWNATTSTGPGTVSSAAFTVGLTSVPSGQATAMTLTDGSPASLAITPITALVPGGSAYGGLTVANNTNAGRSFDTAVTVTKGTLTSTGDGSLAQNITVNAKTGSLPTDCNTTTGYTALGASGLTSPAVAKGGSTVLCFQVSLNSTAPASAKGQTVSIPLTITARQLCGVPGGC
ncbi:hypothetical protein AB0284_17435 [Pseudarthrobacter phenanthrenivorans]|uniref:hypothetical protein n=1 Tax=Pseudarthrobacter phenanthrenivorans TaxID=361575 RepID=UPI00344FDAAE